MSSRKPTRNVVAAMATTHTPGLGDRWEEPPKEQTARLAKAFAEGREMLAAARPDVLILLINDHFDMFVLDNMPAFAIALGAEHHGPPPDAERWLGMTRRAYPGHPAYARAILEAGLCAGFDLHRAGAAEFVHNALMPFKYLQPESDIPVVPVFINCFAPPLPTFARCHALGRMLGGVIEKRGERVALLASGGISHWPPYAREDVAEPDELDRRMLRIQHRGPQGRREDPGVRTLIHQREAEMAASGRELINVAWDRRVLAAVEQGDSAALCAMTYDEVERQGGNGGHEMAMWVALMGAMGDAPARTLVYEPVKEWMGGVALTVYRCDN